MSKTLAMAMTLGALGFAAYVSPALAATPTDRGAECRAQMYGAWQAGRNGDGLDRQREYVFNACMNNGGK